jgi:Flp pilus assembly protein TadD
MKTKIGQVNFGVISTLMVVAIGVGCSSTSKQSQADSVGSQSPGTSTQPQVARRADLSSKEQTRLESSERDLLLRNLSEATDRQDLDQMHKFSTELLLLNTKQADALHALGVVHFRRNQPKAAEYFWSQALKHNPQHIPSLNNLAILFLQRGEVSDALANLRKALDRDYPRVAANLGAYFAESRDYSKAQVSLSEAVQRGYRDARTYSNLGLAQMATGRLREAGISFQEAIKLEPNNVSILFNQAIFFIEHQKDQAQGLALIERIRFLGIPTDLRSELISLENRAKSTLRQ